MAKFNDLPDEIIEIIIYYLPSDVLELLLSIAGIRMHAQRALYATIVIGDNRKNSIPTRKPFDPEPKRLRSPSELLDFIGSNRHITPRRLLFDDPMDAIALAQQYPHILTNVKVELSFWFSESFWFPEWKFSQEYRKSPFKVDSIITPLYSDIDEYLDLELTKDVKSFAFMTYTTIDLKRFSNVLFPNLTSLLIRQHLDPSDLKNLPKYLKKLDCDIKLSGMENGTDIVLPLNLPESLTELAMSIDGSGESTILDLSHLPILNRLSISGIAWDADTPSNLVSKWKFPSRLKFLKVEWLEMIVEKLSLTCPDLVKLTIENTLELAEDRLNNHLDIPSKVELLEIPSCLVSCDNTKLSKNPNHKPDLKFPTALRNLKLLGNFPTGNTVILDCESCNLNSLLIHCIPNLLVLGNLLCLTSLTLNASPVINYNNLQYLESLNELVIRKGLKISEFFYKLPDSLLKLAISESGVIKAHIRAPRLVALKLKSNDFQVLNEHTLTLPLGLQVFDLSGNRISEISLRFPSTLKDLNLSGNRLTSINGLPNNLKKLYCMKNLLGQNMEVSTFPTGMELLSLDYNQIHDDWLRILNILNCSSLKELNLLENKLSTIIPNFFPISLKTLNMSDNAITSFASLKKLINLEEIYLMRNKLRGSFIQFRERTNSLFSNAIKLVDLTGIQLQSFEVQILLDELSEKPNFEKLNVESTLKPENVCDSVFHPRNIRRTI